MKECNALIAGGFRIGREGTLGRGDGFDHIGGTAERNCGDRLLGRGIDHFKIASDGWIDPFSVDIELAAVLQRFSPLAGLKKSSLAVFVHLAHATLRGDFPDFDQRQKGMNEAEIKGCSRLLDSRTRFRRCWNRPRSPRSRRSGWWIQLRQCRLWRERPRNSVLNIEFGLQSFCRQNNRLPEKCSAAN